MTSIPRRTSWMIHSVGHWRVRHAPRRGVQTFAFRTVVRTSNQKIWICSFCESAPFPMWVRAAASSGHGQPATGIAKVWTHELHVSQYDVVRYQERIQDFGKGGSNLEDLWNEVAQPTKRRQRPCRGRVWEGIKHPLTGGSGEPPPENFQNLGACSCNLGILQLYFQACYNIGIFP